MLLAAIGHRGNKMTSKRGKGYLARKSLFTKGLKQGYLTFQEIDRALPPGSLTATDRWLLYYSVRAANIRVVDQTAQPHPAAPLVEEKTLTLQ